MPWFFFLGYSLYFGLLSTFCRQSVDGVLHLQGFVSCLCLFFASVAFLNQAPFFGWGSRGTVRFLMPEGTNTSQSSCFLLGHELIRAVHDVSFDFRKTLGTIAYSLVHQVGLMYKLDQWTKRWGGKRMRHLVSDGFQQYEVQWALASKYSYSGRKAVGYLSSEVLPAPVLVLVKLCCGITPSVGKSFICVWIKCCACWRGLVLAKGI